MQFSNNSLLLYDKNNGIIILNFYKGFSVKNKVCTLELKIDILTKKVYQVLYQKGNEKSLVWNGNKLTSTKKDDKINMFYGFQPFYIKYVFSQAVLKK